MRATDPTTGDWIRGWVAVFGVVAAVVGALLIFAASVACGCTTRPPA
jgi:hypothetical protein